MEAQCFIPPLLGKEMKPFFPSLPLKKKKKGKQKKRKGENPGKLYNRGMEPGTVGLPVIPHLLPCPVVPPQAKKHERLPWSNQDKCLLLEPGPKFRPSTPSETWQLV